MNLNIDHNAILNNASIEANALEEMEAKKNAFILITAIEKNDIVEVLRLLNSGDYNVNYVYENQITPLSAAVIAYEGDTKMMELLIDRSARVSLKFDGGKDAGWTAIENHKYAPFDFLVKRGLPINSRLMDSYETRLITAVKNSDVRMVERLLQLKVNTNDTDIKGKTALHYNLAMRPYETDDARIGELLLAENCDPNRLDENNLAAHAYIKDDRAFAILSNHELVQVDKVALLRMQERELQKELAEKEKAKPVIPKKPKNNYSKGAKYKGKKFRPK